MFPGVNLPGGTRGVGPRGLIDAASLTGMIRLVNWQKVDSGHGLDAQSAAEVRISNAAWALLSWSARISASTRYC